MDVEERKRRIDVYLKGIYNLSPVAKEPHFSKTPCECCKSELVGERYEFTGRVGVQKHPDSGVALKEKVELVCCADCFVYLFG